jgi:hypothetical protein
MVSVADGARCRCCNAQNGGTEDHEPYRERACRAQVTVTHTKPEFRQFIQTN